MFYLQLFCYIWTGLTISLGSLLIGFAFWAEFENKKHWERIRKDLSKVNEDYTGV